MTLKINFLLTFLFLGFLSNLHALPCSGRVAFFQDAFSNKCMTCEPINFRNSGQINCTFPNTDHCCDADSCNENHPNFLNWVQDVCEIPE